MVCQVCRDRLHSGYHRGLAKVSTVANADPTPGKCNDIVIAHHQNLNSLEASALERCPICLRFWEMINHALDELPPSGGAGGAQAVEDGATPRDNYLTYLRILPAEGYYGSSLASNKNQFVLIVFVGPNPYDNTRPVLRTTVFDELIFFLSRSDNPLENSIPAPFHSNSTSSEEALSTASTWIKNCASGHKTCCRVQDESWYPTRLLDLGVLDGKPDTTRVVETATRHLHGPYMTLSHCWGSAQLVKLQKSTLAQFCQSIPDSEMPRTFQDAIQITRRLGVRYLWIDSLCILQGDNADWLRESSLMRNIYSFSYCNISALDSSDSSQGLFHTRDPRITDSKAKVWVKGLHTEEEYVNCYLVEDKLWKKYVSDAPINRRGWVLQERILAPRVLHFGREQLYWECKELDAAETFPKGLPAFQQLLYFTNFKNLGLETRNKELRAYSSRQWTPETGYYEIWHILVYAYSTTNLTNAFDKLIALSGLAKEFAEITQDTYVAGMWRKYLASSLLWRVLGPDSLTPKPICRPSEYRAPSFSWASVDGEVVFPQTAETGMLIEIADVRLEYVTDDITGLVRGGFLDLRGHLKAFQMIQMMDGPGWRPLVHTMKVDGDFVRSPPGKRWAGLQISLDVDQGAFEKENSAQGLHFMPAGRNLQPYTKHLQLLLFEVVSRDEGIFRRIGVARTDNQDDIDILTRDTPDAAGLPCRLYTNGLHTIRVI